MISRRAVLAIAALLSVCACKKKIDLAAFDAGQTAAVVADAGDPPATAGNAAEEDAALAPLTSAKPVAAAAPKHSAAAKPSATATTPPPPPGDVCAEARQICANARGIVTQNLCQQKTAACTAKGGHL